MAPDANTPESNTEPDAANAPEQLTPTEQPETVTISAPAQPKSRRGLILGGSIAAGVLALGLSFGAGYAVAHEQRGPEFAHGQFDGDRDGDHGPRDGMQGQMQGMQGQMQGGQMHGGQMQGMPGQMPGQPGQMPQGNGTGTAPTTPPTTAP